MHNKKENKYFLLLYYIFAIFMILAVIITLSTSSTSISRNYDMQINASNKALNAMEILKQREVEVSKDYDYGDFYESYNDKVKYYDSINLNTGMLGAEYTAITTTIGNLDSKITSLDPNFSAVYIKMFNQLSLKKGDEVVIANPSEFSVTAPTGRHFDHWETRTTDNESMGEYHSGQETTVWNNMTLYAVWA